MNGPALEMPLRERNLLRVSCMSLHIHTTSDIVFLSQPVPYLRLILPEWLQNKMWIVDSWLTGGDPLPPFSKRARSPFQFRLWTDLYSCLTSLWFKVKSQIFLAAYGQVLVPKLANVGGLVKFY